MQQRWCGQFGQDRVIASLLNATTTAVRGTLSIWPRARDPQLEHLCLRTRGWHGLASNEPEYHAGFGPTAAALSRTCVTAEREVGVALAGADTSRPQAGPKASSSRASPSRRCSHTIKCARSRTCPSTSRRRARRAQERGLEHNHNRAHGRDGLGRDHKISRGALGRNHKIFEARGFARLLGLGLRGACVEINIYGAFGACLLDGVAMQFLDTRRTG